MWKSANPPTVNPQSSTPQPSTKDLEKKPAMSTTAHLPMEPAQSSASRNAAGSQEQATIGKALVVKGEVSGSEALYVDGIVEGSINLPDNRVTIGRNGQVTANITAREVVILGKVKGNLTVSDRVDVRQEGSLTGDVICHRLSIEDGAYFKGSIDIRKPQEAANAPAKIESASTQGQPRLPAITA
jgi:cytoskeletal protein CcmA (bactofilin family)